MYAIRSYYEFPDAFAAEIDNGHMRDVEDTCALAHGMMLFFLRPVVQRHVPATEIDDACAGLDVFVVITSYSIHYTKLYEGRNLHTLAL